MTEAEFYQLLQRYLDGRCTPAEQARVAQWYEQLHEQAAATPPLPSQQAVEAAIWQRLRLDPVASPAQPATPTPRLRRLTRDLWQQPRLRWAAGLGLLALGLGGVLPYARHWQATAVAPVATTTEHGWTRSNCS